MILPHFFFGHFVGDYLLQSTWLVVRKSQAWDGLLLHTSIVFAMTVLSVAPYAQQLVVPLLVLYAVHTLQDALKVWLGPRFRIHLAWSYFIDQILHYLLIIGIQIWVSSQDMDIQPSHFEVVMFSLGAALIVVTRFYDGIYSRIHELS